MAFEYKVVGAPERGHRRRGARTRSDRVAAAFEEILTAEATDGWEYLRTDLIPVEEKAGLFSRREEAHRAVMVFRRSLHRAAEPEAAPIPPPRPGMREESEDLLLLPARRNRNLRPEPEIRLAHSSDPKAPDRRSD